MANLEIFQSFFRAVKGFLVFFEYLEMINKHNRYLNEY